MKCGWGAGDDDETVRGAGGRAWAKDLTVADVGWRDHPQR